MTLVKEIKVEQKSFLDKIVYYAIRPEDTTVIDTLNDALAENYEASDFQIAKIDAEDELTGEKYDNCYIVVFRVSWFQYTMLEKAFKLVLNLKFGDVSELLE